MARGSTALWRRVVRTMLATALLLVLVPTAAFAADVIVSGHVTTPGGVDAVGWTATLENLDVVAAPQEVLTDASGNYSFTVPGDTNYLLTVTDPGNTLFASEVVGTTTNDVVVNFDFQPAISGTVTNAAGGAPLADVAVAAYYFDSGAQAWIAVAFASTDANGDYFIPRANLLPDVTEYRVGFDALGFKSEFYNDKPSVTAADSLNFTGTELTGVDAALTAEPVRRIAGNTRYDTSALIGDAFVSGDWSGVIDVIVASGEDRAAADPLSAAGLSWVYNNCPILLTKSTTVDGTVLATIADIVAANPGQQITLHVVGGTTSVPDARINQIRAAVGANNVLVDRVGGATRYDVAATIAARIKASWANDFGPDPLPVPGVLFANGADPAKFFDALAMSAVSAGNGMPILLLRANDVPGATMNALASLEVTPTNRYVAGGSATVASGVLTRLGVPAQNRLAGATRYSTARAIADTGLAKGWFDEQFCGVAAKLPDALAGGAMVGAMRGPLLLTRGDVLSTEAQGYISAHKGTLAQVFVFGGPSSVTPAVVSQITAAMQ